MAATRFSRNERRIIGITSFAHGLCHVSELAFGAVILAVMREFDLTPEQAAAMAVPGFILYGVGAVPTGLWADRRGPREVLGCYFVCVALAAVAIGLAKTSTGIGLGLTALGAAISLYHPAGLTMIAHGCRRRGRAMGINGVAGSLGVALGPAIGLIMMSQGLWRLTYGIIAVLAAIGGCLLWTTPIQLEPLTSPTPSTSNEHRKTSPRRAFAVLAILFLAMLVGGINYRCLTTALPTFLSAVTAGMETIDLARSTSGIGTPSGSAAGGLVFFVLALGGIGQFTSGYLADRVRPAMLYATAISVTVPFAILMTHGPANLVPLVAGVLIIFMFAQQPLENIMIADATPREWRSTVYGIKFVLAFGLASIGAYLTGFVWHHHGLPRVFDLFAMLACLMAMTAILFARLQTTPPQPSS